MSEHTGESKGPKSEASKPIKKRPAQSSTEQLLCKNKLQEYAQKAALPLPIYQTVNEGVQHAPRFRSTVLVEGSYYTSPNAFPNRKAAEQDVARIALDEIARKIKEEGCPLIKEDTFFSKSILNEYLVKMNLDKPTYNTTQSEGLVPVFVSSVVLNGVTCTGETGRSKKEAEQLAARAAIQSILGNADSETVMYEIIKSKFKLYNALHKVKDLQTTQGIGSAPVNAGTSYGYPLITGKAAEVAGGTNSMPITGISDTCSGQLNNIPATSQPFHEFKKPKLESLFEQITPIVFVPPSVEQPVTFVSSSATRKRIRKNKRKAKKVVHVDSQLPSTAVPLRQVPPCSVAQ